MISREQHLTMVSVKNFALTERDLQQNEAHGGAPICSNWLGAKG